MNYINLFEKVYRRCNFRMKEGAAPDKAALEAEAKKLDDYIGDRCYFDGNADTAGNGGDLFMKYSSRSDSAGIRGEWYVKAFNNHIQVNYYTWEDDYEMPPYKAALMLRDAFLDFDATVPLRALIMTNNTGSSRYCMDFTVNPDKTITKMSAVDDGKLANDYIEGLDDVQTNYKGISAVTFDEALEICKAQESKALTVDDFDKAGGWIRLEIWAGPIMVNISDKGYVLEAGVDPDNFDFVRNGYEKDQFEADLDGIIDDYNDKYDDR